MWTLRHHETLFDEAKQGKSTLYKWRQAIRPDPQIDDPESET